MGNRVMQRYRGSCHCGAITFEIETDFPELTTCDCSICRRKNALMVKVHESQFKLISGEARQGDYLFNKKKLHHRFCTVCGIESYAEGSGPDGSPTVGINLRCVEGIDVDKLSPRPWDGRSN